MKRTVLAAIFLALSTAVALPAPVAAQMRSEGYTFLKAVKDKDGDVVTDMLSDPSSQIVNSRDFSSGENALHIVVRRRDATWVRFLLGNGANPNLGDRAGVTPLQLAVQLGFADGVAELVKRGARVDVTNAAGETPLISAVHRDDAELVKVLLEAGANPDRADNSGRTARDYAAFRPGSMALAAIADHESDRQAAIPTYGPKF